VIRPTLEEIREMAGEGDTIPVYKEILGDTETPVSAYLKVRGRDPYAFLFESVVGGEKIARYSFLGVTPFMIFRSRGRRITVEDRVRKETRTFEGDPIAELRALTRRYRSVHIKGLPRFTGGAVGYVSYDAIRLVEAIPDATRDDLHLDEIVFLFFDTLIAFDNVRHRILLISNVLKEGGGLQDRYDEARGRIEALEEALRFPVDVALRRGTGRCVVTSNMEKSDYLKKVARCKDYILAGDIFQVVLSQRFQTDVTVDPFDVYRMLRVVNPSPYMFHVSLDDVQLVGASPELLVRVEDGVVQVRPIAGTRRRGGSEEEDQALERELLADPKDCAEHIMLVDLGRNDVGRVSRFDTVRVTEQMTVERYSHVMHIVSNVRGRLKPGVDALDALFACYPAGTLSGAPKIRAMEILDELEPTRRGVYGGAVGYLDFSGNLDTCIAIRTLVVKDGVAYIQAGGGLVADSVPEEEYQETVNKSRALIRAIEMAERGELT
jgi:anthranilate synthase component 1